MLDALGGRDKRHNDDRTGAFRLTDFGPSSIKPSMALHFSPASLMPRV